MVNCHVLIYTDNVTTKVHVNREGGTRSASLMAESTKLFCWAEKTILLIVAEHIAGADNHQADWLSRQRIDQVEWRLHLSIFQELLDQFGRPIIDLFAQLNNTHLPRFFAKFPCPGAEDVDAFQCP